MNVKLINSMGLLLIVCPLHANYPALVGDVVARDLAIPGAGWAGHTGLSSANHYMMRPTIVLEAMATVPHIDNISIDNFKSASKFWGSRGGIIPPGSYDRFTVANRVVRQYFACPQYSYTPAWEAGTITNDAKPITCGLFRCDTLINYAYAFNNHSLPTYDKKWTTPIGVWNSFPIDTDLLIPESYKDRSLTQSITNETIDSINENNLKDLSAELFYTMLENSEPITSDQIDRLWNLFSSNEVNTQVKILFYNSIVSQQIYYLTNDIINRAKNEHGEVRHQLLMMLEKIYQHNSDKNNSYEFQSIINYFKELQFEKLNKDDGGIVYRGLATLSPTQIDTKKSNLINMDKIHVDVFQIKSDPSNETKYVNDIIYNLDNPDDSLVITATYQYLTLLLINSDLNIFSSKSKELFKNHLNHKSIMERNQTMTYPSAYIEFKAALNAKNKEEIPLLANKYMQSLDVDMRKIIPYGFSDFTQNKFNQG